MLETQGPPLKIQQYEYDTIGIPDAVNTAPTQRFVVGFIIAVGFGLTVITIEFDCTEHNVLEFVMIQ